MQNPIPAAPEAEAHARHISHASNWMFRISQDYGPTPLIRRPTRKAVEDLLATAPWPDILQMLRTMHAQKEKPGRSYRWFAEQANWRLRGKSPAQVKQQRAGQRSITRDQAERAREAGA